MLALLSVLMLSTAPVIIKYINLTAIEILSWRMLLVCSLLFPFAYKDLKKIQLKNIGSIIFASILLFIHFLSWFSGVPKLDIGTTVVIYASNPIFTALLGHFIIGEHFSIKNFISILFSICGIYLAFVSETKSTESIIGVLQIICAAFFYSGYLVYSKKNRVGLNNGVYSFLLNGFTGIMAFIILTGIYISTPEKMTSSYIPLDSDVWMYLGLLALLPSVLGHTLMIYIVPRYNLNFLSCLKLMTPLSSTTMAYFLFNERVGLELALGFGLVLIGVLISMPWNIQGIGKHDS